MAQDEKNGDGDDEKGDDREYYGKDRRRPAREYDHLRQFIDDPWKEMKRNGKGKERVYYRFENGYYTPRSEK